MMVVVVVSGCGSCGVSDDGNISASVKEACSYFTSQDDLAFLIMLLEAGRDAGLSKEGFLSDSDSGCMPPVVVTVEECQRCAAALVEEVYGP